MVTQLPATVNLSTLLALAPGTALTGVEPFETVQSGTSVAVTGQQILSFVQTSFTAAALSVLGVAGNAAGSIASISGTTDQVLRIAQGGTTLGFGAVNLATSAAVTGVLGVVRGGIGTAALVASGMLMGNGTSPVTTVGPGWTNYTATVSAIGGTATVGVTVNYARYIAFGKTVHVAVDFTISTTGGGGGTALTVTLPVNASTTNAMAAARENGVTGFAMTCWVAAATQVFMQKYDASYLAAVNYRPSFSLTYESV